MKQVVHFIRKEDVEREYVRTLQLELDYELATLYDALQDQDTVQVDKSKLRLTEIHNELETLNVFSM
ncbi:MULTISPECIES: hypothetical protein [Sporosarcina]|uniref:hypothetical protein n=1 Tax=Sporosarcina TaxID=1569 RepID=UPI000A150574|nr:MULTISPECIES: hypothetical protein [Sporosarcina]ARJ39915.1 hypothetical protein SporoP8_14125 [Sporosarcina ureae]PIC66517.1 hypothetical protein CSV78_11965 [Sporosarcina sp. P16a]PIC84340.1 hypothetical protein CSV73_00105 [Sporosarcina sp. P1]PIC86535.1 hypothetical protein CSV72_08140 [Sporosarcina sp. P20a]PIC89991.1 hypothetical protein CSV71_06750 [Sporosarcina sp. P21c]